MDVDADFNRDFALLRPVCIDLLEKPTLDAIGHLKNILSKLRPNSAKYLQEYVCIPLFEIINANNNSQSRNENLLISCIDCIEKALSISQIDDVKFFNRILFNVVTTITAKPDPTVLKEFCSEELKLSAVECIDKLFRNVTSSVCKMIYSCNFQAALGHLVYVLLRITEQQDSREVTSKSIDCICAIMQNHKQGPVADRFAAFLPGICIALTKVIGENTNRGQAVTVKALNTWAQCVSLVLDDEQVMFAKTSGKDIDSPDPKVGIIVDRNDEWLKSTSEKLKLLAESISSLRCHCSWKVRLALVQWTAMLLAHCRITLSNCIPTFAEILICLSYDEYEDVRAQCEKQLSDLSDKLTNGGQDIVDLIEEDIHGLVIKLPRISRRVDDSVTICNVRLLRGYLNILKERLNTMLMSSTLLERLAVCLIQLTELDYSDTSVIVENLLGFDVDSEGKSDAEFIFPKKLFKYFNSDKVYVEIVAVCRALGKYGDLQLVVDHFLDKFWDCKQYRQQCILLLNEIILGAAEQSTSSDCVGNILEEYLEPRNWDVQTCIINNRVDDSLFGSKYEKQEENLPAGKVKENIGYLCLLLEGVANCSKVLGPKFRSNLRKVMYPILEKIEDHSAVVSRSAYITLSTIRASCAYESLAEMLQENSDQYFNPVLIKLRYVPESYSPLKVFRAALRIGGDLLVPMALVTVDDLLHCLDSLHVLQSEIYFRLLLSVLMAIEKVHASRVTETEQLTNQGKADANELVDYLLEYHQVRQQADHFSSEVSDVPCNEEADEACGDEDMSCGAEEEMQEKTVPIYVEKTVKILERCVHLMSSKDAQVRLVVLQVVDVGIRVIAHHQNHLLPIVHLLWAPLTCRFADEKAFVIRKAFTILCTMVNVCGEFLEGRFAKEVWPSLLRYLESQAKFSHRIKMAAGLKKTPEFKLVTDILSNLGNIIVKLRVSEMLCAQLILATFRYLSANQHPQVQEAANILYKQLCGWVPDLLWLHLNAICKCRQLEADNSNKCENWENITTCEYCRNTRTLVDILEA